MIEDKFEALDVVGESGNETVELSCKDCKHVFKANMNLVTPKNCEHELGRSVTIICPSCKVRASTTTTEHRAATEGDYLTTLEHTADVLRQQIDEYRQANKHKFTIKQMDLSGYSASMTCLQCNTDFPINVKAGLNMKRVNDTTMMVMCPFCDNTETMERSQAIKNIEMLGAVLQLNKLNKLIAVLKGGKDGGSFT
jgi:uncharacterized Zn finger protein (UPF0148 family)